MVQLGSKLISIVQGDPQQVKERACHLVAITLYKEDFIDPEWKKELYSTNAFIKKNCQRDGFDDAIHAMWGRSMRRGKAVASLHECITIHATVEDQKVSKMLSRSGFNKLFCVAKTREGKPCMDYRMLWLNEDYLSGLAHSAKTTHGKGLVRGRNGSFGFRFAAADFDAVFQVIHPGSTPPKADVGDQIWKLEGLPSQDILRSWGTSMKWGIIPFCSLGPPVG